MTKQELKDQITKLQDQITKLQYANAVLMEKNEKLEQTEMSIFDRNRHLRYAVSCLIGHPLLETLERRKGRSTFPTEVRDEIGKIVGKYYNEMYKEEKLKHHYNGGQP
jgi:hypothetical protein